jgi:hypothetical protein
MPRKSLTLAALLASFPMPVSAARADVGTDVLAERRLYDRIGTEIYQRLCPRSDVVYSRASCTLEVKHVPEARLYERMAVRFGGDLPQLETNLSQLQARVLQIDTKALEFIAAAPDPGAPDLLQAIAAREEELVAADGELLELDDQLQRAEEELARGEDPSVRALWRELHSRRAHAYDARTEVAEALAELRRRYIEANARLLDEQTYDQLMQQRRTTVSRVTDARREVERAVRGAIALDRLFDQIGDAGFIWEPAPATLPEENVLVILVPFFRQLSGEVGAP